MPASSIFSLCARRRSSVGSIAIHRVIVTLDVARQARLLAVLLSFVVLLATLEQAVLAGIVVLRDFDGIVPGARRMLSIVCLARVVRRFGGLVELPVACVVLVPATLFGHVNTLVCEMGHQGRRRADFR
jgi:hypothetical protein